MTDRLNSTAARDVAYFLHPYTNARKHEAQGPLVINDGKGIHVFDETGKEYIEGMAGLWCTSLGFGEQRLVDAATRQMQKLPYYPVFAHKAHDVGVELAERLVKLAPVKMSKAFFNNSGSEANDTAVKMVWYFNNALGRYRKKKIIARMKGYHGVTVASASLTGLPNNHTDFDLPIQNIRHADCPHHYRYGHDGETQEQFASRLAENLELMILREGPDTVAAFIAEPVMGAGGVIVPPRTYFEKIQAVLKKYDVLMIADEVICGFGRTGKMFGTETFHVEPDIMTMAKALSSAYLPISATLINERVYDGIANNSAKIGTFGHGVTYAAHPVCAAVAVETLNIYESDRILDHVAKVSPHFMKHIHSFADHPLVGETRGVGMMGAIELVEDKKTRRPFETTKTIGAHVMNKCQEQGLLIRAIGDSIGFCPPLIITEGQIDDMFARFRKALDQATDQFVRDGLAKVA